MSALARLPEASQRMRDQDECIQSPEIQRRWQHHGPLASSTCRTYRRFRDAQPRLFCGGYGSLLRCHLGGVGYNGVGRHTLREQVEGAETRGAGAAEEGSKSQDNPSTAQHAASKESGTEMMIWLLGLTGWLCKLFLATGVFLAWAMDYG